MNTESNQEPNVTLVPTVEPILEPVVTLVPTAEPTPEPVVTPAPTAEPTPEPVVTPVPTAEPTPEPVVTPVPTAEPTPEPVITPAPTAEPTPEPVVTPAPTAKPKMLEIHQINVSCANAYLIQFGDINLFIDGGTADKYKEVQAVLAQEGVKEISVYIATHWHGDHIDNALRILRDYGTDNTLFVGPSKTTVKLLRVLCQRTERGFTTEELEKDVKNYRRITHGEIIRIGELELIFVGPYQMQTQGKANPDSLNFIIKYGNFKAYMSGDYIHSQKVVEMYGNIIKDCDVLQMPHHGLSPLCITSDALRWINPKVILVPANSSKPTHKICGQIGSNA